jgi:acetyl-CoA carboxylase biotin carboxyl carrier protein
MGAPANWDGLTEAADAQSDAGRRISYEFSYAEALEILRLVDTTPNVRKLSLTLGDMKVEIERQGEQAAAVGQQAPKASLSERAAAAAPSVPAPASEPVKAVPDGGASVRSPIAGIFYRSPAPGEPPFVEVGMEVDADTVVGIIEVMKVLNNIRAGARGIISEICAENEELVQFDQTLFYLDAVKPGKAA